MKTKSAYILLLLMMLFVSCEPQPVVETEKGKLTVSIRSSKSTRTSDTSETDGETAIHNLRIFLFDSNGYRVTDTLLNDGVYNQYCDADTYVTFDNLENGEDYYVCAINNCPFDGEDIYDLNSYWNVTSDLVYDNNIAAFIMAGESGCEEATAEVDRDVEVYIERLVYRIQVKSITNELPSQFGLVTLKSLMLTNVVGSCDLSGSQTGYTWYNPMGRRNETPLVESHIINGSSYVSTASNLTYRGISGVSLPTGATSNVTYRLYGYPNGTTSAVRGFSTTMSTRKTRLVLTAQILGQTYYYPVDLDCPDRNKTYDVTLTLRHLGSNDPEQPLEAGDIIVNVEVDSWDGRTGWEEHL